MTAPAEPLVIAGESIAPGVRRRVDIALPTLYTHAPVRMPVHVLRGRRPGPCLVVTACLHGDEIIGIEIIRRLLAQRALEHLRGTLIAVPVVNIYGFIRQSRYLPDRRDPNRSFPGSDTGSLAARLTAILGNEVMAHASHAIDLHAGAIHRENLPQVRATLDYDDTMLALASAFGTPVILDAPVIPGSLRSLTAARGIPLLLYEGGEALRLDEFAVRAGLRGIIGVLRHLEMIRPARRAAGRERSPPVVARSSLWVRAPHSGAFLATRRLGGYVKKGEVLGLMTDPFQEAESPLIAPAGGIVIGRNNLPLVMEGEALFHLARFGDPQATAEHLERYRNDLDPDTDDEIAIV